MTRTVDTKIKVSAAAADVWELVGDPAAIAQFMPGLESAKVVDNTRHLHFADGRTGTETLRDRTEHSYGWDFTAPPVSIAAAISVEDSHPTLVRLFATINADDEAAEAVIADDITGLYTAALANISQSLEQQRSV